MCEMRIVAGWLLLMWASVLCVRRCAGVRRARAVYVCVLRSRARLCVLRARRRCVLCAVLCCAPVCAAGRRSFGWQGCAVGCGVLRVVARLPDGVRRPRSPPDRVVGGPGREHAVGAACEAAARLARMFPCGEGRACVFTLRARAGAEGGAVSPRSDVGWSSAWRGRARREALPPSRCREGKKESNSEYREIMGEKGEGEARFYRPLGALPLSAVGEAGERIFGEDGAVITAALTGFERLCERLWERACVGVVLW